MFGEDCFGLKFWCDLLALWTWTYSSLPRFKKAKSFTKSACPEILDGLSGGIHRWACCWCPWVGRFGIWVSKWAGLLFMYTGAMLVPGSMWIGLALESAVVGLRPGSAWAGLDHGSRGPIRTQGPLGWAWHLSSPHSPSPMGREYLSVCWAAWAWGGVMKVVWICLSYCLRASFLISVLHTGAIIPYLEFLALVKLFLHVDSCSNWCFWGGDKLWNSYATIFADIALPIF